MVEKVAAQPRDSLYQRTSKRLDGLLSPDERRSSSFRIVQESLNNMIKHAQATEAHVDLRRRGRAEVTVRDNGRGFSPGTAPATRAVVSA